MLIHNLVFGENELLAITFSILFQSFFIVIYFIKYCHLIT